MDAKDLWIMTRKRVLKEKLTVPERWVELILDYLTDNYSADDPTRVDMMVELHEVKERLARLQRLTDQLK